MDRDGSIGHWLRQQTVTKDSLRIERWIQPEPKRWSAPCLRICAAAISARGRIQGVNHSTTVRLTVDGTGLPLADHHVLDKDGERAAIRALMELNAQVAEPIITLDVLSTVRNAARRIAGTRGSG